MTNTCITNQISLTSRPQRLFCLGTSLAELKQAADAYLPEVLDLVSCRNVLIYMNSALQKKIIALFHYTLNQNGFLFLGSSEGIGTYTDLFHCVDTKWKIFKRKGAVLEKTADLARKPTIGTIDEIKKTEEKKLISAASMSELAERLILEQ